MDVVSLAVEYPSYGMATRLGPLAMGFLFTGGETMPGAMDRGDGIGLRGGSIGKYRSQQLVFGILGGETFFNHQVVLGEDGKPVFDKHGLPENINGRDTLKSHKVRYLIFYDDPPAERKKRKKKQVQRHFIEQFKKNNPNSMALQYIPPEDTKPYGYPNSFLYQIDFMIGIGGSVRLGFNLAEFFDLILGIAGMDILEDDI